MNASSSTPLPPDLKQALYRFQRRWRGLQTLTLLGLILLVPLLSFTLLSFSDRFWETPDVLRWILAIPVPLLVVGFLVPWLRRWVLAPPRPRVLARFMGRLDPRIGDRLLGAVELADMTQEAWQGSPALREAAIRQVATELSGVRAEDRLNIRPVRRVLLGAALLAAGVALYLIWMPDAAQNSLQRWMRPHKAIERFTFVRFTGFPDSPLPVPHGEPFKVHGQVQHVRGEPVTEVETRVEGSERVVVEVSQGNVDLRSEGFTQPRNIELISADARRVIEVEPVFRPELLRMGARITWPAYLRRPEENMVMRRRRLEVPVGSRVQIQGQVSRELAEAVVDADTGLTASVDGAEFQLSDLAVEEPRSLELSWVDALGLSPREPAQVELVAMVDQPPQIALGGMAPAIAVLPDEFIDLEVSARDDYGLQRVWTQFEVVDGEPASKLEQDLSFPEASGLQELSFSPERLGFLPGTTVDLVAYAVDAFPGRKPSRSARNRILVLSKEEHMRMILQQMDRVLSELDESIRQEALSLEANEATAGRNEEDLQSDVTTDELLERALDEQARAEELMATQQKMEDLIGEATKNDQIQDKQIAEWAEISEELKNKGIPAMQKASEAMRNAAEAQEGQESSEGGQGESSSENSSQGEPSPSERREQLEEAMARQQEALDAMQQGEQDLNDSIERSMAESFVNRFKELATQQEEVRVAMEDLLPQTIGLSVDQLPSEQSENLTIHAARQGEIFQGARFIYDDLEGFYRRSQRPELREITGQMTAEDYTGRLPALQELIEQNILGKTTPEAGEWSRLFLAWAELLTEDPEAGEGSGGGDGGGEEEGEDLETMIALIRARERQETLRRHTRELDMTYEENIRYDREAVELSDRQYDLAQILMPLENRVKKKETKQLVSLASGQMMNAGAQLRRPVTDQQTIGIQTEVIEMLAQALEQSMSSSSSSSASSSSSSPSASMMQAIMQMMGQGAQPGSSGGQGSTGFGDPGNPDFSGEASRPKQGGDDGGGKAGRSDPTFWPAEFRDAMDRYYEAVESTR